MGRINLNILIKKILESGTEYNDSLNLETFENNGDELKFTAPISFSGTLKRGDDFVTIDGKLKMTYMVSCHLCGKDFSRDEEIEISETYRREPSDEEYPLIGDEVVFDDMIIDNLRLKLPIRFVCKEDCKGICTKCGKNLNIEECNCKDDSMVSPFDVLKGKF